MRSRGSVFAALAAGVFVWFASGLVVDRDAQAGPPPGGGCCVPPPPTCCKPPPPPPPPPPPKQPPPKYGGPRHNIYVPGVNVYVAPSVVVNANVNASINLNAYNYNNNYNNNYNTNNNTNNNNNNNNGGGGGPPGNGGGDNSNTNIINNVITANSSSISNASSVSMSTSTGVPGTPGGGGGGGNAFAYAFGGSATAFGGGGGSGTASAFSDALGIAQGSGYGGGGGQMFYTPPMATGYIQGLVVEGPERRQKVAYEATRRTSRRVVIQAFCLDDRDIPHPASQVTPDREIGDYEGEIFRCIAGTRLQYVVAEYTGKIAFDGGQATVCNKSDSLYYTPNGQGGGTLSCRPQKAARDCHERSLLRRFGAGVKILTIVANERFTEYREEIVREQSTVVTNLALDGGVGGVAY